MENPSSWVNIHLDYVQDDRARYAQAIEVAKYLKELKLPYILLGDFNDSPGSRTLRRLQRNAIEADKPKDDHFTFSATDPNRKLTFCLLRPATNGSSMIAECLTRQRRQIIAQC